jgi:hypothetical protein
MHVNVNPEQQLQAQKGDMHLHRHVPADQVNLIFQLLLCHNGICSVHAGIQLKANYNSHCESKFSLLQRVGNK